MKVAYARNFLARYSYGGDVQEREGVYYELVLWARLRYSHKVAGVFLFDRMTPNSFRHVLPFYLYQPDVIELAKVNQLHYNDPLVAGATSLRQAVNSALGYTISTPILLGNRSRMLLMQKTHWWAGGDFRYGYELVVATAGGCPLHPWLFVVEANLLELIEDAFNGGLTSLPADWLMDHPDFIIPRLFNRLTF